MKIIKKDNSSVGSVYTPVRSIYDDFFRVPSLIDDMFVRSVMPNYSSLSADMWEEGESFFIKMALPGLRREDIHIEIDADVVRIKGGRKSEVEEDEGKRKYYFKSLDTQFEQVFNLPTVVDSDKCEANFEDGVLVLTMPKAEQYKAKQIEVK